jgi:hypothetical protein
LGNHSTSVVVDDLDTGWTSFPPRKADSPLVIDADRILPRPLALQWLKAIPGRDAKIAQRPSLVEHTQFTQRVRRMSNGIRRLRRPDQIRAVSSSAKL